MSAIRNILRELIMIDPHELMEFLSNGSRGHRKLSCIAIRRATPIIARPEESQSVESIERDRGESVVHV